MERVQPVRLRTDRTVPPVEHTLLTPLQREAEKERRERERERRKHREQAAKKPPKSAGGLDLRI
jgi:hypothetical protein